MGKLRIWIDEHVAYQGDDCLPWPFMSPRQRRFGVIIIKGRAYLVQELMCELAHGERPTPRHLVAVSCGQANRKRPCCNPRHLNWYLPRVEFPEIEMDAQTLVIRYRGNSVRVPNAEFVILTEIFKNRGLFVPMSKLSDLIQATPEHLSVRINHLSKLLVQLGLTFQRKWGYGITIVSLPAEGAMLRKHFGTAG